jgi:hypothetical protein
MPTDEELLVVDNTNLVEGKFGTGSFGTEKPDSRDFQFQEVAFGTPPFDWVKGYDVEEELKLALHDPNFKLIPNDQRQTFSCGGHAWSKYGAILEALNTGSYEERSPKFIYAQTYAPGGGSWGRDNARVLGEQGVARENVLTSQPMEESFLRRGQDITPAVRLNALPAKAYPYINVASNIDLFAQAMQMNHGMIMGIIGAVSGREWLSKFPKLPQPTDTLFGHWVYLGRAVLINGRKYVGFINSWGSDTGEAGWQYVDESYFNTIVTYNGERKSAIWQGWTHIFSAPPTLPIFHHIFMENLRFGQTGVEVLALQTALQIDGTFPKTLQPTKFYGTITAAAVLKYQIKYNIAPLSELSLLEGKNVGPITRARLNLQFAP